MCVCHCLSIIIVKPVIYVIYGIYLSSIIHLYTVYVHIHKYTHTMKCGGRDASLAPRI